MNGTVGYLTKRFPRLSETFILDEILGLEAAGVPLRLYALAHPGEEVVQPDVARVASPLVYLHPPGGWRQRMTTARATVAAHGRLLARSPRRYLGVVGYLAWKRHHLSSVRHFLEAGRLVLLLEAEDARHLHAAFAHGPASVAHFVHLLTGLPFSFAAHAKDLYLSAPDLLARKAAAAEFVLVCSESAAAALRALPGAGAARIVLAHHGVDTSRFRPQTGGFGTSAMTAHGASPLRLLAVGRLVEKKGYPILLEALAQARAAGHAVEMDVIGGGPQLRALEARAGALGLAGSVRFLGARTHQEVAAAYLRADAFVQASVVLADGDRDGIPNSLLEAMATGLPVVATTVGGIPEVVIHGQSGLLAPPGDAAALARLLVMLATDRDLQRQLGRHARARVVEEFDRGGMIRAVAPLFGQPAVQKAA
ncbi:MAG: glycosyltransferase family 4 protein [Chloroflexi bacterium]|nr:glycosyltransferase family 4 protein [Chloroflexota bacterium]